MAHKSIHGFALGHAGAMFALALCLGCEAGRDEPTVHGLQRDCEADESVNAYAVVVQGAGFEPAVHADLGCGWESLEADDSFRVFIEGEACALTSWRSSTELLTQVPRSVPEGLLEVVVEGPEQRRFSGQVLYTRSCGSTAPATDSGTATHETDPPTDTPSDSASQDTLDSASASDTESATPSDSATGSDTEGELTCAELAALDSHIVCCPDPPPLSCDPGAWDWDTHGPYDREVGCCASPTGEAVRCELGHLVEEACEPGSLCVFVDGERNGQGASSCASNSCIGAIPIDPSATPAGVVWSGRFSDYEDTWQTADSLNCNNTLYTDIWFEVQVPVGQTLAVNSLGDLADSCIRHVASCSGRTCVDAMDIIDYLEVPNPGPSTAVHISVVPSLANFSDEVSVTFSIL